MEKIWPDDMHERFYYCGQCSWVAYCDDCQIYDLFLKSLDNEQKRYRFLIGEALYDYKNFENFKQEKYKESKMKESECQIPHGKDYSCGFCPPEKVAENIKDIQKKIIKELERKVPLHPGKIYHDIMLCKDDNPNPSFSLCLEAYNLRFNKDELFDFISGKKDLDHVIAYKLSRNIDGTDVRFWMDLQERYDEYMRGN